MCSLKRVVKCRTEFFLSGPTNEPNEQDAWVTSVTEKKSFFHCVTAVMELSERFEKVIKALARLALSANSVIVSQPTPTKLNTATHNPLQYKGGVPSRSLLRT